MCLCRLDIYTEGHIQKRRRQDKGTRDRRTKEKGQMSRGQKDEMKMLPRLRSQRRTKFYNLFLFPCPPINRLLHSSNESFEIESRQNCF